MAKQKKVAFGVAEDGLTLKLAYLSKDGHQISLHALEQVELEKSLYQHPSEKSTEGEKAENWTPDSSSTDTGFDSFNVDNISSFRTQPYEKLFQTYSLDTGMVALNIFDEQIIKLPIGKPDLPPSQKSKLIKENIPPAEIKAGQCQSSVVTINDQSELWIHHGPNRLLEILEAMQEIQNTKYYYQLADANEIALANLFTTTMPSDSSERNMVLYLGKDYKRALIFEGNKWTFSLPIFLTQQSDIEIVYSKLSLALDEAHIADPENLYVCGDNCFVDSVEYLRTQLPNTNVEMWYLNNLYLDSDVSQLYDAEIIVRFVLPIALAWKALTHDNPHTIKSNFLPAYVIENQKVFKIAWHGYLIFALLFITALYLTFAIKQLNYSINYETALNKQLTREYNYKKKEAEIMLAMQKAIEQQQANIETIKSILKGKNPWTEIITTLNNSFQSHPTSWIKNIRRDGEEFKVSGVTTHRPNIVYFAGLFPNGSIINAKHRKIRSFTVWDFEINYDYPEVDWYKMMETDAENLRKYQEAKKELALNENIKTGTTDSKSPNALSQKTDQLKSALSKTNDDQVNSVFTTIDIPIPPKNLTANTNDPMIKAYKEIVTAFNAKNDWLMVDLAVKFVNNYPKSPLKSYVRWYVAYRTWQKKQHDKAILWLEPLLQNRDAVYPYSLLLGALVHKGLGHQETYERSLRSLINEYPTHQCAKTAKRLLNG